MEKHLLIPPKTGTEEGSWDAAAPPQACAACKHQRKKCGRSCPLAPYFPPERAADFQCVHRVFGASNVAKRLQSLGLEDRVRAAAAMVWEAQCWIDGDPVLGAYGRWLRAQEEANALRLQMQKCVVCVCGGRSMAAVGSYRTSSVELMNHNPVYESRRPFVADPQNYHYPQYAHQVQQGGHGRGQLQLRGVPPDIMINGFGTHQFYNLHDQL